VKDFICGSGGSWTWSLSHLQAVNDAHQAGIAHKDVKVENFRFRKNPNGTRTLVLLEFGVSIRLEGKVPAMTCLTLSQFSLQPLEGCDSNYCQHRDAGLSLHQIRTIVITVTHRIHGRL